MEQATFSQKLHRLEDIVRQLESPDIELEDGLKLLEEGVSLHKQCQAILTESQVKITNLLKAEPVDGSNSSGLSNLESEVDHTSSTHPNPNQDELPF